MTITTRGDWRATIAEQPLLSGWTYLALTLKVVLVWPVWSPPALRSLMKDRTRQSPWAHLLHGVGSSFGLASRTGPLELGWSNLSPPRFHPQMENEDSVLIDTVFLEYPLVAMSRFRRSAFISTYD